MIGFFFQLSDVTMEDFVDGAYAESPHENKPDTLTGPRCRARFDFDGEGHEDLAFEDGDVIQLLSHCGR